MDPNQQPTPIQPLGPQFQSHVATAPQGVSSAHDSIQDAMRKRVLLMIGGLSALSVLGVLGIFLLSGVGDVALSDTKTVETTTANYSIPNAWGEDTKPGVSSYFNASTVEQSQASYVVVTPRRANFNTALMTEAERNSILDEYEQYFNRADIGLSVSERSEISLDSFAAAYEYDVSGLAEDGRTQLSGTSRILFDSLNYAHVIEFVAVKSYYDANTADIDQILNSYKANQ